MNEDVWIIGYCQWRRNLYIRDLELRKIYKKQETDEPEEPKTITGGTDDEDHGIGFGG